ncbi:MAG TPA: enoyl-CoA hydratase/isomerase family protein, partial [Patescibacteria group bacterium]|nr:enoyl-CoA hydratase/isomerase family protein [Patescibacteria group bacterium]
LAINRPERRNVVDHDLLGEIAVALQTVGQKAGAVVLRGTGGVAFSAGFDLDRIGGTDQDLEADQAIGVAVESILACPVPVISMIQGHCHGGGVELALSCDLRIASHALQLSLKAVSLGVVYRYQLVSRLVSLAGLGRATDLLLAMPTLDAATALEWGLVSEVHPASHVEARTRELAEAVTRAPRSAVEGTKASLVMAGLEPLEHTDLERAARWRRRAATSPERRAALAEAKKRLGRRA